MWDVGHKSILASEQFSGMQETERFMCSGAG